MPAAPLYLRRAVSGFAMLACCMLAGCRHRQANVYVPPPPPLPSTLPQPEQFPPSTSESAPVPRSHERIIFSQVGIASWYGEPYHNSRTANGHIYRQDAMTAANRILPMGSVVRVTNLRTGQAVVVTITDRGPFVPGRMIDLSRGAANVAGIRRAGTARVRMDVLESPKPIYSGGRWQVQIGAFKHRSDAVRLRDRLQRRYPTAYVIEFAGNADYWVRIRPENPLHRSAMQIIERVHPVEGQAYLVRMD